jgi:hypothetical protein
VDEQPSDFMVWIEPRPYRPMEPPFDEVRARAGIPGDAVYREWAGGFGARLTTDQVEAARRHPDVGAVELDEPGRPAPYRRRSLPDRVPGSYFVVIEDGADPEAVARRSGIVPKRFFTTFHGFSAEMTDEELDVVRRTPGVYFIYDNIRAHIMSATETPPDR